MMTGKEQINASESDKTCCRQRARRVLFRTIDIYLREIVSCGRSEKTGQMFDEGRKGDIKSVTKTCVDQKKKETLDIKVTF